MKGTYCLIIELDGTTNIKVGSLGELKFEKGFYVYVGSALNSLESRVKRHLSDDKKLHWHVDYLLMNSHSQIREVIFSICQEKIECALASLISKKSSPVHAFGCSDCRCNSHLLYFAEYDRALSVVKSSFKELNLSAKDLNDFRTMI